MCPMDLIWSYEVRWGNPRKHWDAPCCVDPWIGLDRSYELAVPIWQAKRSMRMCHAGQGALHAL